MLRLGSACDPQLVQNHDVVFNASHASPVATHFGHEDTGDGPVTDPPECDRTWNWTYCGMKRMKRRQHTVAPRSGHHAGQGIKRGDCKFCPRTPLKNIR
jgi:hypothetical protein